MAYWTMFCGGNLIMELDSEKEALEVFAEVKEDLQYVLLEWDDDGNITDREFS